MPKDLIEKYNQLRYKKDSSVEERDFVDFLYENTEVDAPDIDESKAWDTLSQKMVSKNKTSYPWLKIAASFVLICVASALIFNSFDKSKTISISSTNQKLDITFPDGSQGVLNKASSFSYLEEFGDERRVSFEGEAYFDIKKSEKPFIIEMEGVDVVVLGTAFNLNTEGNQVELYVERGLVAFEQNGSQTKVAAGEVAVFDKESASINHIEEPNANILSWKNGMFKFEETPLSEALPLLEEFYNVSFKFSKESIANCKITASFENDSLQKVVETLETLLTLKSHKTGNNIKFSGEGC